MELTPENFQDFLTRLKYHHRGKGVNDHCTANPLYIVQCLRYVDGIDLDYDPDYYWTDSDHEVMWTQEEFEEVYNEFVEEGNPHESFNIKYDNEVVCGREVVFQKIGYAERWEYVCAHFTREAAEAFIKRKGHDYKKLRIFVDSQYWCWEFNAIVDGLLSGKIGFIDENSV